MLKRELPKKASLDFEKDLDLVFPESEPKLEEILNNSMSVKKIPVCEPLIGEDERRAVKEVMDSGWVSSLGPEVRKFEREFAHKIGTSFAVSCTSGTAALHLALATIGIGPGDEVIIPTFTMIATVSAILYCGGTPVLVDSDVTLNIDPKLIEEKITKKTKAIIPVHIYGYPCDMNKIMDIAKTYNLWIIEDVAESHGAKYKGVTTGAIGDMGIFSGYANKIVTTGEGGMITTNEPLLAERLRTLMNHAFSPERHFCHKLLGYNYRLTAMQAALGRAQLSNWDYLIRLRKDIRDIYVSNLIGSKNILIPNVADEPGIESVCWMFGVVLNPTDGHKKNKVREILAKKGVDTRNFFVPMHLQPVHYDRFKGQRYKRSEILMQSGFYLPTGPSLKKEEIDYVSKELISAVGEVYS